MLSSISSISFVSHRSVANRLSVICNERLYWLTGIFEAALYLCLMKRETNDDIALLLVNEFLEYSNLQVNLALPVALRMQALVRAQRGEDVLALESLHAAKKEAKRYDLLYEIQLIHLIETLVFRDQLEIMLGDHKAASFSFHLFGCTSEFPSQITSSLKLWIRNENDRKKNNAGEHIRWRDARMKYMKKKNLQVSGPFLRFCSNGIVDTKN